MSVVLQLDSALEPAPPIDLETISAVLAVVAAHTADSRLEREVCVRVCSEAESRELNASYRGKDAPTNVLSFPADPALPADIAQLGDLAICWPVVLGEAESQGKAVADHFLHLYVHGLLHLLGFDHEADADAAEMEKLEVGILAELGVADPYAPCK